MGIYSYTVKKVSDFPALRMSLAKLFLAGYSPPAGDGKIANLFYSVVISYFTVDKDDLFIL
jgi:hypothetical protein